MQIIQYYLLSPIGLSRSAASFIALAAHKSSCPGTSIGAAHPVEASGKDIDDKGDLKKKIQNDTAALMRSIAQKRSRNETMMVSFVVESVSLTAEEALKNNVIDSIDKSAIEFLESHKGETIDVAGIDYTIAGSDIVVFEKLFKERFLEILSDPNIFYLLFMAGIVGVGFELIIQLLLYQCFG